MVRITLTIPEDLRYRMKLALMNLRRKNQDRLTQDEFCAQAWTLSGMRPPLLSRIRPHLKQD